MSQEQGSHASYWRVIKGAFQAIPTLPRATFGPNRLVCLQLVLCYYCCGEHQLQTGGRHRVLGHAYHFNRLRVKCMSFDSEVPT